MTERKLDLYIGTIKIPISA